MTIKVMALDIDGTLLDDRKVLSAANREAVLMAQQQGIEVVLCTGRPIQGVQMVSELLRLPTDLSYYVAYNGSLVENWKDKTTIFSKQLSRQTAAMICRLIEPYSVDVHGFTEKGIISFKPEIASYTVRESYLSAAPLQYCEVSQLDRQTAFYKFMIVGEPEKLEQFYQVAHSELLQSVDCYFSEPHYLEVVPKGINKGAALQQLLTHLKLSTDQLLAIGDNYNDLEMLQLASVGVAMANSPQAIKDQSDHVTDSNNHSGVAAAIKHFV